MDSFEEIKSLWHTNETANLSQQAEIEAAMRKYNQQRKRKTFLAVALLVCCLIILVFLISFATFNMWTTYFGILFWMGIALFSIYLKILKQNKFSTLETRSNNDFLIALEKEENQTCTGKSKNQGLLFIAWAIGFFFFIYEPASKNVTSLFIGYGALIVYIVAVWVFYIPIMTKRYQRNMQNIIAHINSLKSQINENS